MTVHHTTGKKLPALSAHCRFDDHIRCVAAKKNLNHKKESLQLAKMASICEMIDVAMQSTTQQSHSKGHHYSKLTVVSSNTSPPLLTPVKPLDHHMTPSDHVSTSFTEGEAIEFDNKNDDGSLMLPFKGVEMNQLGYSVTQQSSTGQLNMFLQSSSFSHEDHHLDQHNNFNQRQLSIDQQQQLNHQVTKASDDQVTDQTTEPH